MSQETQDRTRSLLRTRHTMLHRIRDWEDQAAWRDFFEMYHNYIYRHARGSGLTHHESEDLAQEVFQKVAEKCDELEIRTQPGSFRKWLRTQVRWRIVDRLRKRGIEPSAPIAKEDDCDFTRRTATLDRIADDWDSAERWELEWQEEILKTAKERIARSINPQHLQVFQLHHEQGWSLVKVARELGINLASAYAINSRTKKRLRQEANRLREQLC